MSNITFPIYITTRDEGVAAEASIVVGGRVVGYVGGSRHESTVREVAEAALADVLEPLIRAHPDVNAVSRFYDYDHDFS